MLRSLSPIPSEARSTMVTPDEGAHVARDRAYGYRTLRPPRQPSGVNPDGATVTVPSSPNDAGS